MRSLACTAVALVTLAAMSGCTPLDGAGETYAQLHPEVGGSNGSTGRGGGAGAGGDIADANVPLPPEWQCLRAPQQIVKQAPHQVTIVVPIVDFDSQPNSPTPVPGVTVKICDNPLCSYSTDAGTAPGTAVIPNIQMAPFLYAISVPYNFVNGYLHLTAPDYIDMDYYFGGPIIGLPEGGGADAGGYQIVSLPVPLLKTTRLEALYRDIQVPTPIDSSRGVLAARMINCNRDNKQATRAAGVLLQSLSEITPPAAAWALSFGGIATPGMPITDDRGAAGYANLVPGAYTVWGVAPVGAGISYGRTPVRIRANTITIAEIRDGLDKWGQ